MVGIFAQLALIGTNSYAGIVKLRLAVPRCDILANALPYDLLLLSK
jgi:hypothetical protein